MIAATRQESRRGYGPGESGDRVPLTADSLTPSHANLAACTTTQSWTQLIEYLILTAISMR
jgi:hypothetical protein